MYHNPSPALYRGSNSRVILHQVPLHQHIREWVGRGCFHGVLHIPVTQYPGWGDLGLAIQETLGEVRWTLCQNSGAVQRSCGRDRQPFYNNDGTIKKPASYRAGSGHGAQAELRGEPLAHPIYKSKKCLCTMPTCSAKGCGTLRTPRRPTALTSL